jgi:hypothetical protein
MGKGGSAVPSKPRGYPVRRGKEPDVTNLDADQQEALANLSVAYPAGLMFTEDRGDAIAVYESLVESGHAVRVDLDEGRGFQLSEQMAEAHRRVASNGVDQASQN